MEGEPIQTLFEKLYSSIVECISFPQNVTEQDHVRIMSLHASKGLSAKFVVIMSCIDDLLRQNFYRVNCRRTKNSIRRTKKIVLRGNNSMQKFI